MPDRTEELEAIYARIPDPNCKGLCQASCTIVPMTVLEARRLRRNGTPLVHSDIMLAQVRDGGDVPDCAALVDGRCSVYEVRPLICRLWGAVEDLACPYGCVPEGGHLTKAEAHALMDEAFEVGGGMR